MIFDEYYLKESFYQDDEKYVEMVQ